MILITEGSPGMHTLKAPVFNIQPYSIHDGPGIRTTVFLKGCPLRCLWCANPESNLAAPQLLTYPARCTGCGKCVTVCPQGCIRLEEGKAVTCRENCTACGACTAVCPRDAREIAGKEMTVGQVLDRVLEDRLFLEESGGGMTLSGGECLLYPDFSAALLEAVRAEGLNTAVESCCYASRDAIDRVFAHVDHPLLDIKHMDPQAHKRLTGVDNGLILQNIRHIRHDLGKAVTVRVPVIPGCNDSQENFHALGAFVSGELGTDTPVHLLPYHRMGEGKTEALGRNIGFSAVPPAKEDLAPLRTILESYGLTVQIGG